MSNNRSPFPGASAAYCLSERIERLCWYAGLQWCRDPEGDEDLPAPDIVEVHLERVVQLADDLREEVAGGDLHAALETFTQDLDRAWQEYQTPWGQPDHREVLRVWEERHAREADCPAEVQEAIVKRSPALQQFQIQVRESFHRLLGALPDSLRLPAEVGQLLARPDYPGADYERAVAEAGGSVIHYVCRVLRRQVQQRLSPLVGHFPGLANLKLQIGGHSEHKCLDSVSQLRERVGKLLARAGKSVEDRSTIEPAAENPVAGPDQQVVTQTESATADAASGALTFEPGAFIYRGHRVDLKGKPLQVLQALAQARWRVCTLKEFQDTIWQGITVGEETIRSAIKTARKALRQAMRAAKVVGPDDPIENVERGAGQTAWRLDLP